MSAFGPQAAVRLVVAAYRSLSVLSIAVVISSPARQLLRWDKFDMFLAVQ